MCEPATILAIGSAVVGLYAQDKQAKATNAATEVQRQNIHQAAMTNYAQANRQGIEDRENQSVQGAQIQREMASRLGTARVSAGAAGIGGASVDALMLDLAGQGLAAGTTSETNYARTVAAREDQAANIGTTQRSQLASARDVQGPGALDYLGAGLKVGASYYTAQNKQTAKIGSPT